MKHVKIAAAVVSTGSTSSAVTAALWRHPVLLVAVILALAALGTLVTLAVKYRLPLLLSPAYQDDKRARTKLMVKKRSRPRRRRSHSARHRRQTT